MKSLKGLLKDKQEIEVPFFDESMEGFTVTFSYVSRDALKKIRDASETTKFNRKTRQPELTMDTDLFQRYYVDAAVKGWKGLKLKYVADLTLIDIEDADDEDELEYSPENAYDLITTSPVFDSFVSEVMKDFSFFNKRSLKETSEE